MTHARAGAAVIGLAGLAVAVGDLSYIAHQWHALDSQLHRGFALGLALFALTWDSPGRSAPANRSEAIGS
jgi:hypothetical protein